MRITTVLILLTLISAPICLASQSSTYAKLTEYEGVYRYQNNTQLTIAASPKALILYAIIGGAKYPLHPHRGDIFLNGQGRQVTFVRNAQQAVIGYHQAGDPADLVYARLAAGIAIPESAWYPRTRANDTPFIYRYNTPVRRDDGLAVGDLAGTGLSPALLGDWVTHVVDERYPDVHSILILKDSKLVLEEYFYEYDIDSRHQLRSATKSFVSALVGIAIDQGLIKSVDERVLPYFKEYPALKNASAGKARIRIADLLAQQSGLDCNDWDRDSPGNENKMVQHDDWVKFVLDLPMQSEPGASTSYCSGGVIVLGRIIEKASGMTLPDFADKYLFKPLAIDNYAWRFKPDKSSAETFCQLHLTPRAMAKFGLLFANNGVWRGQQIISADWVNAATAKHAFLGDSDYGYLWWHKWLNVQGERFDALVATGNGGQKIMIWPELDMVAVLTGGNYNQQSPTNTMLINHLLPPFKDKPVAPAHLVDAGAD